MANGAESLLTKPIHNDGDSGNVGQGPVPIPDEVNSNFAGVYSYLRANPM